MNSTCLLVWITNYSNSMEVRKFYIVNRAMCNKRQVWLGLIFFEFVKIWMPEKHQKKRRNTCVTMENLRMTSYRAKKLLRLHSMFWISGNNVWTLFPKKNKVYGHSRWMESWALCQKEEGCAQASIGDISSTSKEWKPFDKVHWVNTCSDFRTCRWKGVGRCELLMGSISTAGIYYTGIIKLLWFGEGETHLAKAFFVLLAMSC